jgi:hypothetical protein
VIPIGPGIDPKIGDPLRDHNDRLRRIEQPGVPLKIYTNTTATTAAELPSPADFPQTVILLIALDTLAWSDGTSWIRQDTQGALA